MSNQALVDSQVALWSITDHAKLGRNTINFLNSVEEVFVSVLSIGELKMKLITDSYEPKVDLQRVILDAGFQLLSFEQNDLVELDSFKWLDGVDPFTRLICCQAFTLGGKFVTADQTIIKRQPSWVIDARD